MKTPSALLLFIGFFKVTIVSSQVLELEKIMSGNSFIGEQPELGIWTENGEEYIFEWNTKEAYKTYFSFSTKTKEVQELETNTDLAFKLTAFTSSKNEEYAFKIVGNELFRKQQKEIASVMRIYESMELIEVMNSGKAILKIDNNYFEYCAIKSTLNQLTNIHKSEQKEPKNGDKPVIEQQQSELFEFVRNKNKTKKKRGEFYEALNVPNPHSIYISDKSLSWISFGEKFLIYELSSYPKNKPTTYSSFVNETGHTKSINARAKVGTKNPEHSLFWKCSDSDSIKRIDIAHLSGILDYPEYQKNEAKLEFPKDVIFHEHGFNESKSLLLLEIKSYDNKDRWICTLDSVGKLKEIDHQHDNAWIGGPGISGWNMVKGNLGWINDERFYFQSEKSGYSHLYTYDFTDDNIHQLTEGKFEIHEAWLDKNHTSFFIIANKKHPGNREFYRLTIKDQNWTAILTQDGNHEVSVSPNEKYVMVRYSYKNKPWELYWAKIEESAKMIQVTHSTSNEFNDYSWRSPSLITFKATDNQDIYARIYEPDSSVKNGAAILFVHGAGYLQNAHNWWSGYYREYMFNNLLCDKGYTVLDIDYRASKGYGRDFRTGIYRYMGGKDLSDQMDGRQLLINKYGIDEDRIGMYGGSYGGFITLMALLTEPGKFKCGAALRSVTDWAHYNHPYTSNILNTPDTDPESFRKSSPIYYAENLEDHLIMLHGMEDDNVHYQDVVRLSQRFIELGKKNWSLIGYPVEKHGFQAASSWTDEYQRILELFDNHLIKD